MKSIIGVRLFTVYVQRARRLFISNAMKLKRKVKNPLPVFYFQKRNVVCSFNGASSSLVFQFTCRIQDDVIKFVHQKHSRSCLTGVVFHTLIMLSTVFYIEYLYIVYIYFNYNTIYHYDGNEFLWKHILIFNANVSGKFEFSVPQQVHNIYNKAIKTAPVTGHVFMIELHYQQRTCFGKKCMTKCSRSDVRYNFGEHFAEALCNIRNWLPHKLDHMYYLYN